MPTEIDTETETAVGYIRLSQDGKSLTSQRRDIKDYATEHGAKLVTIYDEGKRSSGFDTDRPEYTALREHVADGGVDTAIVPNLSCLSYDRKERLRLLLDVDTAGVAVHSVELGRAVDLDDDWALVHQSIRATTDDVEKRKEIARSKRATQERIEDGYDHGRPPFGLTNDEDGRYWVPNRDTDEYRTALACIRLRKDGHSWREIEREASVNKDTARRIYTRRERYLPANPNECSPTPPPNHITGSSSV